MQESARMIGLGALVAVVLGAAGAPRCGAGVVTLDAVDRGHVNIDGASFADDQTYLTGRLADIFLPGGTFRSYFVFDLSAVEAPIASLTLHLFSPASGAFSNQASETLGLFDVELDPATLVAAPAGVDRWDDLGSGPSYGTRVLGAGDLGVTVDVELNETAVLAASGAAGRDDGLWAIGGALLTLETPPAEEYFFGSTADGPADWVQLTVETVPAPGGAVLLGVALAVAAPRRRR